MAIIKCPECGKDVSDTIKNCIHCGYELKPATEKEENVDTEETIDKEPVIIQDDQLNSEEADNDFPEKANDINASSTSTKTRKSKIVFIGVALIVVVVLVSIISLISSNTLHGNEKHVYEVVSRYQNYLKDPDSLLLRGDVLYVRTASLDEYVAFSASGSNSYGATVTSMPMFKGYSYLGDYEDDSDDISSLEERKEFLEARVIVASWNLVGKDLADGEEYLEAELIKGKKIASKLHCDWKDSN